MLSALGPLANIAGSALSFFGAKDKNKQAEALAAQEYERQKEFAKMGIQWKVADATAAGVHPLFALGASTSSYAPQSIGLENASAHLGKGLADMGQDLSRAATATMSQAQKGAIVAKDALVMEGMKLDNDIKRASLASAIQKLQGPSIATDATGGMIGGKKIEVDPGTTNVEDFWSKRYGEPGEWIGAPVVLNQDLKRHGVGAVEMLRSVYDWLNRNSDPQFGNKLFDRLRKGD